ncbi:hypothetical protein ACIP1T_15670 [Pseudomonas japonica]|uniref:hypothetical protein n=1 Tax=Pseudomonas japonica TaxID=256466 RepID=UPI003817E937
MSFAANLANRMVVGQVPDVHIPTANRESVEYRFGWFTGVVIGHCPDAVRSRN